MQWPLTLSFVCSTNEFRNAFLRTIRQIIRESVRNMAVPFTKAAILAPKSGAHLQTTASTAGSTHTVTVASSGVGKGGQPTPISSCQSSAAQPPTAPSSSSQGAPSSSSNSAQEKDKDKATSSAKTKPPPPPRAASTQVTSVKSTPLAAAGQVTCSANCTGKPPVPPHGGHVHTHGKNAVCCGLCGADVGVGLTETKSSPAASAALDNSDTSGGSNSGARPKVYKTAVTEESFESDEAGIWQPRP